MLECAFQIESRYFQDFSWLKILPLLIYRQLSSVIFWKFEMIWFVYKNENINSALYCI